MKIKLNGIDFETRCVTLEELLNIEGHKQKAVATAVNGEFVAIENRAETPLTENDAIEIIAPMSGG